MLPIFFILFKLKPLFMFCCLKGLIQAPLDALLVQNLSAHPSANAPTSCIFLVVSPLGQFSLVLPLL